MQKLCDFKIQKVSLKKGIILGWGIVCTKDGEDYFDSQDECFKEDGTFDAVVEFSKNLVLCEMHARDSRGNIIKAGNVVFHFPLIREVADSYNIKTDTTGWMVGAKPYNPEILKKLENGEYTGLSVGGVRIETEEIDA